MEKKCRYFPEEFKRQAAERVETSGLTIMDVAAEPGVHETRLRRWIRQFGRSGMGCAQRPSTQAQSPSPAGPGGRECPVEAGKVCRVLQKARTERDILEKAALLFGTATR